MSIKLDETLENGNWLSITRDLEKDLQAYRHPFDPTENTLIAINGMIIYGSALVDDIKIEGEESREHQMLTITEPLTPSNCKGEVIKQGLDLNDNGVLEENEVTSTNENYTEGTPITRAELQEMIENEEDVTQVNTCKITDMRGLFFYKSNFNQNISQWNTGSTTNMGGLFVGARAFNQPIGDWDVSKVTDMNMIFFGASNFNQPIGDWNVSNVINMQKMFYLAEDFNQPINNWDVSKVIDMKEMFTATYGGTAFNQDIGEWNVSNVTDMSSMFRQGNFNQSLEKWDTSSVINMQNMFYYNDSFNQPIGDWNVSNVINMNSMFEGADSFNQPIGEWDVSHVTDMGDMFADTSNFNQPIGQWDVSHVTNMNSMFGDGFWLNGARSFNQPIGEWNTSSVTTMQDMFLGANKFNQCIKDWNISNIETIEIYLKYTNQEGETKYVLNQASWDEYALLGCQENCTESDPIGAYLQDHPLTYEDQLLTFSSKCAAYIMYEDQANVDYLYYNPDTQEVEVVATDIDVYSGDPRGGSLIFQNDEKELRIRRYWHDYVMGEDRPIMIILAHEYTYAISDPQNPHLISYQNIELGRL